MRTAICAAIIEDNKILLVRKNRTWILPGGKPEKEEKDLECLTREIDEELSGTKIKEISFYKQFEGRTPHKGDILSARVYFANLSGELYAVRKEDSISEVKWVTNFEDYNISEITSKIINSLKQDDYLE